MCMQTLTSAYMPVGIYLPSWMTCRNMYYSASSGSSLKIIVEMNLLAFNLWLASQTCVKVHTLSNCTVSKNTFDRHRKYVRYPHNPKPLWHLFSTTSGRVSLWSVSTELDTSQGQNPKIYCHPWSSSGSGEANFSPDTICPRLTDWPMKTRICPPASMCVAGWLVNHLSTVDRLAACVGVNGVISATCVGDR